MTISYLSLPQNPCLLPLVLKLVVCISSRVHTFQPYLLTLQSLARAGGVSSGLSLGRRARHSASCKCGWSAWRLVCGLLPVCHNSRHRASDFDTAPGNASLTKSRMLHGICPRIMKCVDYVMLRTKSASLYVNLSYSAAGKGWQEHST